MTRLLYFAGVRDVIGVSEEDIVLPPDVATVDQLLAWMETRGHTYAAVVADRARLRVAVDLVVASGSTDVRQAMEIALFPPVTGG